MEYDDKILSEILSNRHRWTICSVYFIREDDLRETIGMEVKYYEKDSKYSVLMGGRFHIMKEDYFNYVRNKKLKKLKEKL